MQRHSITPRRDWKAAVEEQGLIWHSDGDKPYWDESAYYAFTLAEIEKIEAATGELHGMFLKAAERVVATPELMTLFGIPAYCHRAIQQAWHSDAPALDYGRFDFGYDGEGDPKLFEFNCDTPTSMLEAGVVQWTWKEELFPDNDQFTSLHEKLIARWSELRPALPGDRMWFTHVADASHEDTITTTYMRDLAAQAGLETHAVVIDDIGVDAAGRFVDNEDRLISAIFKLYPWEWLMAEAYGPNIVDQSAQTLWIEPIWKMVCSNKAILGVLWDMFPDHPNLLAASDRVERVGSNHVAKPFLAREGANIDVVRDGQRVATSGGDYLDGQIMFQQLYPLKDFGNGHPVIGSWVVAGEAAGMGIREDGLITGNQARFIPHIIEG
ncbi:glutathionylspermidine synthase family protein [Sphingomonas sp. LY160]|uniref:glutathionylspermidine synthase family protein n=1 Tax=Sphingomonas sp. LY160 TaxID=3095342 RepID=UPI002ADEBF5A|nr:glutathionylspermidine synthase family protein [Sphingomonas sp. LY160]MEA1072035.1 glutathionylspermidine synthase family protein [Sphingomonas sp. LY160]